MKDCQALDKIALLYYKILLLDFIGWDYNYKKIINGKKIF
jgi:hypothetical protein